ncbi:SAM-dependent methyltransferase [Streptomyces albogriseolus]
MPHARETAVYTHGHHESVLRSHTWRTARNSAAYLLGALKPHMRILDIGCGPGTITADLAALVPDGHVTGLDREPGILERARAVADERGLTNADFVTGDVHALDFPDDTFCVVHAHQVLQHVGDPVAALREMRRVTKPGGYVAVRDADYAAMTWYPESAGLDDWLNLYRRVARANGGEPDAGRRLKAWALEAGFTDVTATTGTWTYSTAEERAWWSGLWADRTVASAYAERAVAGGHATRERLEAAAAAWREWGRPGGRLVRRAARRDPLPRGRLTGQDGAGATGLSPGAAAARAGRGRG